MNKFVVYTVVTGGYDNILQPEYIDNRFDYILFSNDFSCKTIGIWEIKKIPFELKNDNKRLSRYPKSHPENLLSGYVASLYIDANINIRDKWVTDRVIELYYKNVEYAGVKLLLTGRDCIYDHSFDMMLLRAEHDYTAIKQCYLLHRFGFPEHYGLNENNIIYRAHTQRMKRIDDEWWHWIQNYSSRDQFSYMFCLWKNNMPNTYFLPISEDSRTSKHFCFINHDKKKVDEKKWVKGNLFERLRVLNFLLEKENGLKVWHIIIKSPMPILYLRIWGILSMFINMRKIINYLYKNR